MDVGLHNLADFPWETNQEFQSCIKQSLLTVLKAYVDFGFFHKDCHSRNFIIKKTSKSHREYIIDDHKITIPLYGYETFMMDLEDSLQNQSATQLYTDLWEFCYKIVSQMNEKIDARSNRRNTEKLEDMKRARPPPPLNTNSLLLLIDSISQSIVLKQSKVEGGRYKLPWRMRRRKTK